MVMIEVRKYMEAAVEKLTPARAQEMARSLVQAQGQRKEQVQKVAQDLMEWSAQTRERLSEMIRREVTRQLETMGVASKNDLEALRARVRDLELAQTAAPAEPKSASRKPVAKTTAKQVASKPAPKPTAGRPTPSPGGKAGS